MTETKPGETSTDEWTYTMTRGMPPFPWEVNVLRNGRRVKSAHASFRWGGRMAARKIRRQRLRLDRHQARGNAHEKGTL